MSGMQSDKHNAYAASASGRRLAMHWIRKHAPGVIKTSLYLGLIYLALFVGVGTCRGQDCGGRWVYHGHCANGDPYNCWSDFSACPDCSWVDFRDYCWSRNSTPSDIQCACDAPPKPDVLTAAGSVFCSMGDGGWCRGEASLSLAATDSRNHAVSFSGSINGAGFSCGAPCSQNLPEGEGNYSWSALCTGGKTASGSGTYKADGTPPILAASLSGGIPGARGWYRGGPVSLSCSASDALSGLAGLTYGDQTADSEGKTTLSCAASDVAGNASSASYPVSMDSSAPSIDLTYSGNPGNGGWYVSQVIVTVRAMDTVSGIFSSGLRVDGGGWAASATLGDGEYTIEARAEDYAGNAAAVSGMAGVDTQPPETVWSMDPGMWVRGIVSLKGMSSDATSGIAVVYISIDGENWNRIGAGANWTYEWDSRLVPDGPYEILARADDAAGNREHTASLAIQVDNTPPEVNLQPEWTADSSGSAGGSDAGSGIARARVTVSRAGMIPWVQDYSTVPSAVQWDRSDGRGGNAGYGDFDVTLGVWDAAGNSTQARAVIHNPWPRTITQPAAVEAAAPEPISAAAPEEDIAEVKPAERAALPRAIPFWPMVLPVGALGAWLAASNVALARDRRWSELRGIRQAVARYLDQKKTNFPGEEDDD